VSPLDVSGATPVASAGEFDRWLRDHVRIDYRGYSIRSA
jgi:hypothetical protein